MNALLYMPLVILCLECFTSSIMVRDRVAEFFREKTPRRGLALVVFLLLLVIFRKLLLLIGFFVLFERALHFTAGAMTRRFKIARTYSLLVVLALTAGALSAAGLLSAGRVKTVVLETRESLPLRIAEIQETPLYTQLEELLPDSEKLVESAKRYAQHVAESAKAIGHFFLMSVVGFILAIVFFLDEEKIRAWRSTVSPMMFFGTIVRWVEHTAEALTLLIQLQMIVALCNTVLTLPVLWLIGIPHIPMLMALIFIASLVPVVGNIVSGVGLSLLACVRSEGLSRRRHLRCADLHLAQDRGLLPEPAFDRAARAAAGLCDHLELGGLGASARVRRPLRLVSVSLHRRQDHQRVQE